jgi:hypothetical protein
MKAISKTVARILAVASLAGGNAAVAVAVFAAPATTAHPAPQAATATEYAL